MITVATIDDLKKVNPALHFQARVTEGDQAGLFVFISGNWTAGVDVTENTYVKPSWHNEVLNMTSPKMPAMVAGPVKDQNIDDLLFSMDFRIALLERRSVPFSVTDVIEEMVRAKVEAEVRRHRPRTFLVVCLTIAAVVTGVVVAIVVIGASVP